MFDKTGFYDFISLCKTLIPCNPLKLHSIPTPWSGTGLEVWNWNGVNAYGLGVGMELEISYVSETIFIL